MTTTTKPELTREFFSRAGKRGQDAMLAKFRAQVDIEFADLSEEHRDTLARWAKRLYMGALGRMSQKRRRSYGRPAAPDAL